jgi:hypothetical protein
MGEPLVLSAVDQPADRAAAVRRDASRGCVDATGGRSSADLGFRRRGSREPERSPGERDALAHAARPEAAGVPVGVESLAVVAHAYVHHALAHADVGAPGVRVLDHVGERLLTPRWMVASSVGSWRAVARPCS